MPHVVNKAVEEQFKRKSAVVKEMLAPESKGRDRCGGIRGGCKQNNRCLRMYT